MSARKSKAQSVRVRPGNVYAAECPSRVVLDHLTSRWGVLVLVALLGGTHRFGELTRKVEGVSEKMLSQTLQSLEGDGFILRVVFAEVPPRVEYSLTPLGREAAEHIRHLVDWIQSNLPRVVKARARIEEGRALPD